MKFISKLIPAVLAAALMLTMCSCQLSKLLPEKTEDAENTTASLPSFTLPGSFLQEIYGKQLSSGGIVKGNFYKCDETIHPHFGTWNRVIAPQPDFHRPECFGEMQVEA